MLLWVGAAADAALDLSLILPRPEDGCHQRGPGRLPYVCTVLIICAQSGANIMRAARRSKAISAERQNANQQERLREAVRREAEEAGLLEGQRTEHLSVRTTKALVEAARRRTGLSSNTQLVELALATVALPDPVSVYMAEHFGELVKDHQLEY